jgi:hypothetical protein
LGEKWNYVYGEDAPQDDDEYIRPLPYTYRGVLDPISGDIHWSDGAIAKRKRDKTSGSPECYIDHFPDMTTTTTTTTPFVHEVNTAFYPLKLKPCPWLRSGLEARLLKEFLAKNCVRRISTNVKI